MCQLDCYGLGHEFMSSWLTQPPGNVSSFLPVTHGFTNMSLVFQHSGFIEHLFYARLCAWCRKCSLTLNKLRIQQQRQTRKYSVIRNLTEAYSGINRARRSIYNSEGALGSAKVSRTLLITQILKANQPGQQEIARGKPLQEEGTACVNTHYCEKSMADLGNSEWSGLVRAQSRQSEVRELGGPKIKVALESMLRDLS